MSRSSSALRSAGSLPRAAGASRPALSGLAACAGLAGAASAVAVVCSGAVTPFSTRRVGCPSAVVATAFAAGPSLRVFPQRSAESADASFRPVRGPSGRWLRWRLGFGRGYRGWWGAPQDALAIAYGLCLASGAGLLWRPAFRRPLASPSDAARPSLSAGARVHAPDGADLPAWRSFLGGRGRVGGWLFGRRRLRIFSGIGVVIGRGRLCVGLCLRRRFGALTRGFRRVFTLRGSRARALGEGRGQLAGYFRWYGIRVGLDVVTFVL